MVKEVKPGRVFIGRLPKGGDLLESLTAVCRERKVELAKVSALGAVEHACVAYYHLGRQEYETFDLQGELEILSLTGNVSLRDGAPIVHAHVVFGDAQGRAFGGHLTPGTIVFACEFVLEELTGARLERGFDAPTGLPLWPADR